jgi:hypothetical protein
MILHQYHFTYAGNRGMAIEMGPSESLNWPLARGPLPPNKSLEVDIHPDIQYHHSNLQEDITGTSREIVRNSIYGIVTPMGCGGYSFNKVIIITAGHAQR